MRTCGNAPCFAVPAGQIAELVGVDVGVLDVDDGAVDGHHPPLPVIAAHGGPGRDRDADPVEQGGHHLTAQTGPGLRDRRRSRHFPVVPPDPQPAQTVGELPDHLVVAIGREQAHRQHQIHHHPRRQQPRPGLPTIRPGDHLVHDVPTYQPGQHTHTDHIGQPPGSAHSNIEVTHTTYCGTPQLQFTNGAQMAPTPAQSPFNQISLPAADKSTPFP